MVDNRTILGSSTTVEMCGVSNSPFTLVLWIEAVQLSSSYLVL